jgi:hypothetical protein
MNTNTSSLSVEVAALLMAATRQVRNRGAFTATVRVLQTLSDAELAAGIAQPRLAHKAGVTDRSIRRAMTHLCDLGVVSKTTLARRVTGYTVDRDRLDVVATTLGI